MPLSTQVRDGVRYCDISPRHDPHDTYLLLHGLGNSLDFWTAVAPILAENSRVVALDMPGFGRSRAPKGAFSLRAVSAEILDFLAKIDLSSCIVVAHSLGSIIAADMAARAPETFSRLIMVDGALIRASSALNSCGQAIKTPGLAAAVGVQFALGVLPVPRPVAWLVGHSVVVRTLVLWPFVASPKALDPDLTTAALANNGGMAVLKTLFKARTTDYTGILAKLRLPVDVVWGGSDLLMDREDVELLRGLVEVSRVFEIPSCGHWPLLERPHELASFILSWRTSGSGMVDVAE